MPTAIPRTIPEAEAGFSEAVDRIFRHEARLAEEGTALEDVATNIARVAMVATARQYAIDLTAAYLFSGQDNALQTAS